VVKSGFGIGRQECKDGREEFVLDGKGHSFFKDRRVILVESENKSPADGDTKPMKVIDDLPILRGVVLKFLGFPQVCLGK
jgi:hypothetical protein